MRLPKKLEWFLARRSLCKRAGLRWLTWKNIKRELFPAKIVSEPDPHRREWLAGAPSCNNPNANLERCADGGWVDASEILKSYAELAIEEEQARTGPIHRS